MAKLTGARITLYIRRYIRNRKEKDVSKVVVTTTVMYTAVIERGVVLVVTTVYNTVYTIVIAILCGCPVGVARVRYFRTVCIYNIQRYVLLLSICIYVYRYILVLCTRIITFGPFAGALHLPSPIPTHAIVYRVS